MARMIVAVRVLIEAVMVVATPKMVVLLQMPKLIAPTKRTTSATSASLANLPIVTIIENTMRLLRYASDDGQSMRKFRVLRSASLP